MKRMNEAGFGLVGILLIVLIVVGIGLVGWVVWDSQTKDANNSLDQNNKQDSMSENQSSGDKSMDNRRQHDFMNISEWDVKLSIDSPTIDEPAYTKPKENNGIESVYLYSKAELGNELNCVYGESTLTKDNIDYISGYLLRGKDKDKVLDSQTVSSNNITKVDGYYYSFQNWTGGGCSITDEEKSINQAFIENWQANKVLSIDDKI